MSSKDGGRPVRRMALGLAALGVLGGGVATAQVGDLFRGGTAKAKAAAGQAQKKAQQQPAPGDQDFQLKAVAIPVNPSEPIAKVNGEVITRQQLADECVARKGEEILDTLIARKLIDQAMKAKNITVSAADIDAEIERVAQTIGGGMSRENWLRTLHKERGISPVQYARDVIYPSLALRKLALPRITVTPTDYKKAFATSFGPKLRARIILVNQLHAGKAIWEELKKNPERFEKIAKDDPRSIDEGTRSLGGMLAEPIRRYSEPSTVSDAAYRDLVDGDPTDSDKSRKPKDGDISGLIQVSKETWVIIKRESLEPGEDRDPNNPVLKQQVMEAIKENKVKEEMGKVYADIAKAAAIENRLVGAVQEANEDRHPDHQVDGQVKLTSDPDAAMPPKPGVTAKSAAVRHPPAPTMAPAGK